MNNAKHTPGPWKVDGSGMGVYTETGVNAAGFCPMVASTAMADVDLATARANAFLIAALPELLEALNSLLPDLKQYAYSVLHDDDLAADLAAKLHDALIAKHDAAFAVVAKATGAKS